MCLFFLMQTVHPKGTPLLSLTEAKIEALVGICQCQRASRHGIVLTRSFSVNVEHSYKSHINKITKQRFTLSRYIFFHSFTLLYPGLN